MQFENFIEEAHRLKKRYSSQIALMVGAETEYISSHDLDNLSTLLGRFGDKIEYLVGSVHHVNEIPIDFDRETYSKAVASFTSNSLSSTSSTEMMIESYLDAQYELLTRFQPEVVGHFDLFRLFNPDIRLCDLPVATAKAERNIEFACRYGALFELNAAAFRKGWSTAYPGRDIVDVSISHVIRWKCSSEALVLMQIIEKHNGRFTFSDDSHGPHAVGLNFDRLFTYAQSLDIKKLWYLETESPQVCGRSSRPVELASVWWAQEFWNEKIHS